MKTTQKTIEYLEYRVGRANEELSKFRLQLEKTPTYAMEWSLSQFSNAAWASLAEELTFLRETQRPGVEDDRVEKLAKYLQKLVIDGAKRPARSTSPTANLMEQEMNAVRAELFEYLTEAW